MCALPSRRRGMVKKWREGRESDKGQRPTYIRKRRVCTFCADKIAFIDYKDLALLRRFISDRGQIDPRRKTGTCAKHQRVLCTALKRARHIALLPFTSAHIRETGGLGLRDT